ncbi:MAG: methyltransferase domain-containing protein [Candidatus Hydrogenedentota bacterium]
MDEPELDPALHADALVGLSRINLFSGSARVLWPLLCEAARRKEAGDPPLRVLDVATGGGDIPLRLWKKARRAGIQADIAACDASEVALAFARKRVAAVGADVRFFLFDVLSDTELPGEYDVVCCSLFLHHLNEDDACRVLQRLARVTRDSMLVNDLVRNTGGLLLAAVGPRLLSRSPVVHYDATRSVHSAFTEREARALAERAGLHNARFTRHWPCRYLLSWRRT